MSKRDVLLTLTLSAIANINRKKVEKKYVHCEACGRSLNLGETVFRKSKGNSYSVYYDLSHALSLGFVDVVITV